MRKSKKVAKMVVQCVCILVGVKTRALYILDMHSTTEQYPHPGMTFQRMTHYFFCILPWLRRPILVPRERRLKWSVGREDQEPLRIILITSYNTNPKDSPNTLTCAFKHWVETVQKWLV